jgi:hypothetical protein
MAMSLVMLIALVVSVVVPVVVAAVVGVVSYVKGGRLLQRLEADQSSRIALPDLLDQVHIRLDAMNDRLARIEQHLRNNGEPLGQLPKPEEGDGGRHSLQR